MSNRTYAPRATAVIVLSLVGAQWGAAVSSQAATAAQKCEAAKEIAAGKRALCLAKVRAKRALGKTLDETACEQGFQKLVAKASSKAAAKASECRWINNGDGTATDLHTGLQWELKTDDGAVHDMDNTYRWSTSVSTRPARDGDLFGEFLATLNGGAAGGGYQTQGCFAGHCDWRLPTIEELLSIVDPAYPGCVDPPCSTIPGPTTASADNAVYWTLSVNVDFPTDAWSVPFDLGQPWSQDLVSPGYARAVRGGS